MKHPEIPPAPKIGLLLHKNQSWSRRILPGLARYARSHTTWELTLYGDDLNIKKFESCDGLIGAIYDDAKYTELNGIITARELPCVNVSGAKPPAVFPQVTHDNHRIGVLAAEHLMELGLQNFACVTLDHLHHTAERFRGFSETLVAAGFHAPVSISESQAKMDLKSILKHQTFPLGIFAVNDIRARHVEGYVHSKTSWKIPTDIALVGCDNDFMECELSSVPLSSIELQYEEVGYQAAAALDRQLRGEEVPSQTLLPPLEVVRRRSTDYLLNEDTMVRRVLDQLRARYTDTLSTAKLARQQGLTSRHLQRRFKAATGKTLQEALLEIRLEHARELLRDTPLTISEIAMDCGFTDLNRFPGYFRRKYGFTPRAFRNQLPKR